MTLETSVPALVEESAVRAALDRVRDPELDEPITTLRFVEDVRVDGDRVEVDLRLPTYFCAPNFAYLMVADARDEVAAVPGVGRVAVRLLEHFASEEINAGVSVDAGFDGSFPANGFGEDDDLAELRRTFTLKAHRACQERVASALIRARSGTASDLAGLTLGDAPAGPDKDRLLRRRRALGLPADDAAPLLVHDDGRPIRAADLPLQLRIARTTRISIEGNGTFCRGLLQVRYGLPEVEDPVYGPVDAR